MQATRPQKAHISVNRLDCANRVRTDGHESVLDKTASQQQQVQEMPLPFLFEREGAPIFAMLHHCALVAGYRLFSLFRARIFVPMRNITQMTNPGSTPAGCFGRDVQFIRSSLEYTYILLFGPLSVKYML
jgi:hypothetical protein